MGQVILSVGTNIVGSDRPIWAASAAHQQGKPSRASFWRRRERPALRLADRTVSKREAKRTVVAIPSPAM